MEGYLIFDLSINSGFQLFVKNLELKKFLLLQKPCVVITNNKNKTIKDFFFLTDVKIDLIHQYNNLYKVTIINNLEHHDSDSN